MTREQRLSQKREYYRKNKHKADDYYQKNKTSILERERLRYVANREKILAYQKQYDQSHKEQSRRSRRAWKESNREAYMARRKQYGDANRERILIAKRKYHHDHREERNRKQMEYHRAHPEVLRQNSSKRRAIIRKCQVNPAGIREWMKEVRSKPFARCYWCGTKVSGRRVHFDHIIALSKGGTHTIGNLCTACPDCNHSKNARLITDWVVNAQSFLSI